jgi:hypothetical protein
MYGSQLSDAFFVGRVAGGYRSAYIIAEKPMSLGGERTRP